MSRMTRDNWLVYAILREIDGKAKAETYRHKVNACRKGPPGTIIGGICRLYPRFSRNFLRLCFADVVRDETLFNVSVKIAFDEAPPAFLAVSINT